MVEDWRRKDEREVKGKAKMGKWRDFKA